MSLASGREAERLAAGFVLAGGQSSRMGTDKALLPLAGRPLIEHMLSILHEAGLEASLAGARSVELARFAPIVLDAEQDRGPLAGICAALAAASSAPCAVFLPVDTPLIPASLLTYMLRHADLTGAAGTLVSVNGSAQTFPAVVHRRALPALQAALGSGHRGCFHAFRAAAQSLAVPLTVLPVELLVQAGQIAHPAALPAVYWFSNINTPRERARAERFLLPVNRVS